MTLINWLTNILFFSLGAVQVSRVARARKLPNLYWLAANFATASLGGLINLVFSVPLISIIGLIVSSFCIVMFVQRTFYRDRKSPYLFIMGLLLIVGVVQIYSFIKNPMNFIALTQIGYAVVWGWQAVVAFLARREIAKDRTVEDWVKTRYLLWMIQTLGMCMISTRMLLPVPISPAEWNFNSTLVILGGFVQYITWVMPAPIRQFLNRNYKPVIEESPSTFMNMTEEEVMQQIKPT